MKLKEKLKEKLKDDLTEEELLLLPRGFQTIGNTIIIKLNPSVFEKKELIGKAYLEILPSIESVYINLGKVKGQYRMPEKIEHLVGENNPIVIHKEHGISYKFDFTKIMFSKGNVNERKFLATLVRADEIIVDMFAGIGYFSLPIGKHSPAKKIYSIELNPIAYKFLVENIKINHLEEKIVPIHGDSKVEVMKLSNSGIKANRVIMGVFPAPKDYIKEALTLTREEGTIFHYEGVIEGKETINLFNEFEEIALKENYSCSLNAERIVKSYGPHLYHAVLDIAVTRKK